MPTHTTMAPTFTTPSSSSTSPPSQHPAYLPHLDGLRALALALVLLFHFTPTSFPGGFVGVDAFLTLSGFLITRNLLLRRLQTSTTSTTPNANPNTLLPTFFTRRFLRLYPASLATIVVTTFITYLLFADDLAKRVSLSALSSLFLSANFYFHARSGYFDADAVLKPLLHMWSLSLEEQFYLLWAPALVLVVPSSQKNPRAAVAKLAAATLTISFLLALLLHPRFPSFVFFQLPARMYQFAAGALLAAIPPNASYLFLPFPSSFEQTVPHPSPTSHTPTPIPTSTTATTTATTLPTSRRANVYSIATEAARIIAILILFTSAKLLPPSASPLATLPATLATLLLIATPTSTIKSPVARLLSTRPLRLAGRLSYPAYLVHWPLVVYLRYLARGLGMPSPSPFLLTAVTFALATALHLLVEKPFRPQLAATTHSHPAEMPASAAHEAKASNAKQTTRLLTRRLVTSLIATTVVTIAFAALGVASNGFSFRHTNNRERTLHKRILDRRAIPWVRVRSSPSLPANASKAVVDIINSAHLGIGLCGPTRKQGAVDSGVVLVGNSYAGMWRWALADIGRRHDVYFRIVQKPGCGLLTRNYSKFLPATCRKANLAMWQWLGHSVEKGSLVGLSPSWWGMDETDMRGALRDVRARLEGLGLRMFMISDSPGIAERGEAYFVCAGLSWTPLNAVWSYMRGFEGGSGWAYDCLPGFLTEGFQPFSESRVEKYRNLKRATELEGVPFVDLFAELCTEDAASKSVSWKEVRCRMPGNTSVSVYDVGYNRDRHHLSPFGSLCLASFLEKHLDEMGVFKPRTNATEAIVEAEAVEEGLLARWWRW